MDESDRGGGPADRTSATPEIDRAWHELREGLSRHLAEMTDEDDHLVVEMPEGRGPGCTPYAQFAGFGGGTMLRAELSGNAYLNVAHRLDDETCDGLRTMGWLGNDEQEANWYVERPLAAAAMVAAAVVGALREVFGVEHPQLLTYRACGPSSVTAPSLGLSASEDVVAELPDTKTDTAPIPLVCTPADRDELIAEARAALRLASGDEPPVDEDGDLVLSHLGQPVYVRARGDQPAIEILARVAHDVYSLRSTAVEIAVLNRTHTWTQWLLRDREVWLRIILPALPFVPSHLVNMVEVFCSAMEETREDLAFRVGGKVA